MNSAVSVRVLLCVLALLYLGFALASHVAPFDPRLEPVLAFGPFLLVLALTAMKPGGLFRRGTWGSWRDLLRPWPLAAVFAIAISSALASALSGNLSLDCPSAASSCVKIDQWLVDNGRYYRHHPFDTSGRDDPAQPWVEVSRQAYVDEVGTRLRQAALAGIIALFLAWAYSPMPRRTMAARVPSAE